MKKLTQRQEELLRFIQDHLDTHGFPPSIREMADHMSIRSTNGVNDHLKALEKKGYILRNQGFKSRAISLLHRSVENNVVVQVPILGRVAAGLPVLAEENMEGTICMEQSLLPAKPVFALRVHGDSMIEKGILSGDIVFVRSQPTAEAGQIVVALVDGETTVKTYKPYKQKVYLQPANSLMKPIVVEKSNLQILGIVAGVYRQL